MNFTILGISGSLRKQSYNTSALRAAAKLLPDNVSLDIFDLDGIPGFSEDLEQTPPPRVVDLKKRVLAADAILFSTPEYNYSISGVLKNAIDWASRPYGESAWNGKPAAIMGASIGSLGTARAQYHLRQIMVTLNMFPINKPEVMIGDASKHFDQEGILIDSDTKAHLQKFVASLVEWSRIVSESKK